MATPWFDEYPTIGGLMCGSRGIHCYDFDELLGFWPKAGDDWPVPDADGDTGVPRGNVGDRAWLYFEINGKWDQDNQPVVPGSWRSTVYSHLAAVRTVTAVKGIQTIQLTHPGGPTSGDFIVHRPTKPRRESPEIYRFRLAVALPDGPLLA